jgi:anti-sigma regulatory factor (Ser/Thr protein kinase)
MTLPQRSTTLHEELPATADSVALARHALRRFTRGMEVDVDGMVLAVSEAVANVVAHAYADGAGDVELSAVASPHDVQVVVRDHGRGLDGGDEELRRGYGMAIIRRLAEHVTVDDSGHGLELTMRFRRGGAWSVP